MWNNHIYPKLCALSSNTDCKKDYSDTRILLSEKSILDKVSEIVMCY